MSFKEKLLVREPGAIYLARQTSEKSGVSSISDEYLKRQIIATNHIVASPGGMIVPYEGGYGLLALMEKDWTGNKDLVKNVLDAMAALQNTTVQPGSWDQMYHPQKDQQPYQDTAGHRRQVDSGAALMAWAMADYDARNSTTTYQTYWQKAVGWIKSLENPSVLGCIWNQVISGVKEEVAFTADIAECILAGIRGLDAYGENIGDLPNANMVKGSIRQMVSFIDWYMWQEADYYYQTEYPKDSQSESKKDENGNPIYITFKQCVTFVQALIAWALHEWDTKYGTKSNLSQDAAQGQPNVVVSAGEGAWFAPGDRVLIKDDNSEENNKVQSVNGDTLTMENNLANNYTVAANAYVKTMHTVQIKKALDQIIALNQGRWGGFIEHMQYTTYDYPAEYTHYAALMRIAMNKVDSTRYARWISKTQSFLRQCALADGQVMDEIFFDGRAIPHHWARGPLLVSTATAILSGA